MLRKLLKYDVGYMKKLWKFLFPIIPAAALIGAIAIRVGITMISNMESLIFTAIVGPLAIMLGCVATMGVAASSVINSVFVARRLTSSFYSDEAYLTFMLPVKRETLLLSKFINAVIWNLTAAAMLIVCIFIYLIVVPIPEGNALLSFVAVRGLFRLLSLGFAAEPVIMSFAVVLVPIILIEMTVLDAILLQYFVSITRSLVGIALWIATYSVISTAAPFVFSFGLLGLIEIEVSAGIETAVTVLIMLGTALALAAIGLLLYLKTQESLKYKLNVG